jgi:chemotaxis family two-component system response regulator Rcp1
MSADFHILLVEDSRADVRIIRRALAEGKVPHRLTVVSDGGQALAYLARLEQPDAPVELFPELVLLDLNLPGIDGYQVLSHIKSHPSLRAIPVVVLTTSRREEDVRLTYRAGANTYIAKPEQFPGFRDLVQTLSAYWHETALQPPWGGEPP